MSLGNIYLAKSLHNKKIDLERDCKVQFGTYVQVSDEVIVTNTMEPFTHRCIELGTSGNWQGSTMLDRNTGKVVTNRIVKELPYPDRVIKYVSEPGKTPRGEKYSDGIEFHNRKRHPFDWENEELAETLPEVEESIYPDILAEVPGLVLESDLANDSDAVMTPALPTMEEQSATALSNAESWLTQMTTEKLQECMEKLQEWTMFLLLSHLPPCRMHMLING